MKDVNDFLRQLILALAPDMRRILDHFCDGDIREENLETFIHQNIRIITAFEFTLHQRRQRAEQAASVALAESTRNVASIAVPPPEEEPTVTDNGLHHHCTSHAESISLSSCSNDTVSSPRSQETMQGCGSYSSFQPAAVAIGSTPRASNVQNGHGMVTRKRYLSPPAESAGSPAKDDAAKPKNRRLTIDGLVACPNCGKGFIHINKHKCKITSSTSAASHAAEEEVEEEYKCTMCRIGIKGRQPFCAHVRDHFPNKEMTNEHILNNYRE